MASISADWSASRGRVPVATAVDFALQALDALGEAHTTGIVHRDLKPANLFATNDGVGRYLIKVLDFGVAKSLGSRQSSIHSITAPGTLVGSPCYMPPEQLLEAEKADARSDIWALGATLFELLTGEPPFHAPSMPQLYAAIAHGRIRRTTDLVAETPRWLDAIVSKCRVAARTIDSKMLRPCAMPSTTASSSPRWRRCLTSGFLLRCPPLDHGPTTASDADSRSPTWMPTHPSTELFWNRREPFRGSSSGNRCVSRTSGRKSKRCSGGPPKAGRPSRTGRIESTRRIGSASSNFALLNRRRASITRPSIER